MWAEQQHCNSFHLFLAIYYKTLDPSHRRYMFWHVQQQCKQLCSWMASSSTERVNQHLPPSCFSPLCGGYNQTSPICHSANQIPYPPPSLWSQTYLIGRGRVGGLHAGQGRGFFHSLFLSLSPSECFSLTVCDSGWMGDCSHTLALPMVDHIPHLTSPHCSTFDTPPSHLQDSTWDCGNF